ncbi:hypothetical protein C8R45DRAFT_936473 [Mycena sanguinolenta]|nr:hypothetical protein C8R45DRAFT_936473 [Mycena sanguinolenta]
MVKNNKNYQLKAMAEAEVVPEVKAEAAFLHWSMLITKHTKWRGRYKGRGRHDGGGSGSGSGGGGGGGGSIAVSAICGVKGKEHNNNAPPIPPPLPLLPSPPPPPLPPLLPPPPSYWCYAEAHWANCMEKAKFPVMFLVKEEVLALQNMLDTCVDAPRTLEGAYSIVQAVRRRGKANGGDHSIWQQFTWKYIGTLEGAYSVMQAVRRRSCTSSEAAGAKVLRSTAAGVSCHVIMSALCVVASGNGSPASLFVTGTRMSSVFVSAVFAFAGTCYPLALRRTGRSRGALGPSCGRDGVGTAWHVLNFSESK